MAGDLLQFLLGQQPEQQKDTQGNPLKVPMRPAEPGGAAAAPAPAKNAPLVNVGQQTETPKAETKPTPPVPVPGIPVQRADAKNPIPGTQHVDPATNKEVGTPYTVEQKTNPFLGIFAHSDNIHNPVLRTLAKIGSGIGAGVEAVGQGTHPELAKAETERLLQPGQMTEQDQKNRLIKAQADEAEASATAKKSGAGAWEPEQGEQFTQYKVNKDGSQGEPIAQLWHNKTTGAQEWRPIPSADGKQIVPVVGPQPGAAATLPQAPPLIAAPTAGGATTPQQGPAPLIAPPQTQFGTKQMTKPEERLLSEDTIKPFQNDIAQATKGLNKNASAPVAPSLQAGVDTGASAKAQLLEYEKAINTANQEAAHDKAEREKQQDQMNHEERAQAKKDERTYGSALDPKTNERVYTTLAAANQKNMEGFEPMTQGAIQKEKGAARQFNDVQAKVSRYEKAISDYSKTDFNTQAKDLAFIHSMQEKVGAFDFNISIGEGGKIELPIVSKLLKGLSTMERDTSFNSLSPQGKAMVVAWKGALAAVPAYVKALTDTGRSNKEVMDLELAQMPNPSMSPQDALMHIKSFQENIDRGQEGRVHFRDIENAKGIQQKIENPAPPAQSVLPKDIQDLINMTRQKPAGAVPIPQ